MSHNTHEQARVIEFPNFEVLRQTGWAVNTVVGQYCVAFRGPQEVVLVWRDGQWRQVSGRGGAMSAAA